MFIINKFNLKKNHLKSKSIYIYIYNKMKCINHRSLRLRTMLSS